LGVGGLALDLLAHADNAAVSNSTEQVMQPLLRRMGYRSLKQFEAAYA
jgi:hypothetical protein